MSTKIWVAYRLKKGHNLWEVLRDIRKKTDKRLTKILSETYDRLIEAWKKDPKARLEAARSVYGEKFVEAGLDRKKVDMMEARDFIYRAYQQQKARFERNTFDLDLSLAIRHHKGRYYLIPYPGSGLFGRGLDWLKRHPALEDYHYQNQSDRPPHISSKEWSKRADVWEFMLDEDRWCDMVALDIVTPSSFSRIDPWMLRLIEAARKTRRKS